MKTNSTASNPFMRLQVRYLPEKDPERSRLKHHFLGLQDQAYAALSNKLQTIADRHSRQYSEMVIRVLVQLQEVVYPGHELRVHIPSTIKQHEAFQRNLRWQISSFTSQDGITYDDGAYDWVYLVTVGISVEDDGKTSGFIATQTNIQALMVITRWNAVFLRKTSSAHFWRCMKSQPARLCADFI